MLIGDHTYEAALASVDIVAEAENQIIAIWDYLRNMYRNYTSEF